MTTTRTPAVFTHGLWLHASSWQPRPRRGHSLTVDGSRRAVQDECPPRPGKQDLESR
jgi:hypothetical protein